MDAGKRLWMQFCGNAGVWMVDITVLAGAVYRLQSMPERDLTQRGRGATKGEGKKIYH